tara:strand:+ start:1432 stop:1674 length:243 start_codon:yes stop_codon:yes gene_type:complete
MKYQIKDFHTSGSVKYVGFTVTDANGNTLLIDKTVAIESGKTNESYVQDALALCQDEINEWTGSFAIVGMNWNPTTNQFE